MRALHFANTYLILSSALTHIQLPFPQTHFNTITHTHRINGPLLPTNHVLIIFGLLKIPITPEYSVHSHFLYLI